MPEMNEKQVYSELKRWAIAAAQDSVASVQDADSLPCSGAEEGVLPVTVRPFPKHGVTLAALRGFVEKCGGAELLNHLTTTQMCDMFIKSHMLVSGDVSYCDYLASQQDLQHCQDQLKSVKNATVFISHAWGLKFMQVVKAIEDHFAESKDVVIWFDLFSNNQFGTVDIPFDWWATTFKDAIKQFGHTVMILSPWNDPIPLTRVWCLYEIFCTVESGGRFEVVMSAQDKDSFLLDICSRVHNYQDMLTTVDVERSQAWKASDRKKIFAAIRATVGFDKLNTVVIRLLRQWAIGMLEENSNNKGKLFRSEQTIREEIVLHNLASMHELQGRYDLAEPLYEECIVILRSKYGEDHTKTLQLMTKLGSMLESQFNYDKADTMYSLVMNITVKRFGASHKNSVASIMTLVEFYTILERFTEAEALLLTVPNDFLESRSCVDIRANLCAQQLRFQEANQLYLRYLELTVSKFGESDGQTGLAIIKLAGLFSKMGRNEEAEHAYLRSLSILRTTLGENHVRTLEATNMLATIYMKQERYHDAEPIYQASLKMAVVKYGENHPDTFDSLFNVARLYHKQLKFELAETSYRQCESVYKEIYGGKNPTILMDLADMYASQEKFEDAETLLQQTLSIVQTKFDKSHSFVEDVVEKLANLYLKQDKFECAESIYEQLLGSMRAKFGDNDENTMNAMGRLAVNYFSLGKYEQAEPLFVQYLRVMTVKESNDHPNLLTIRARLAISYTQLHRHEIAAPHYQQCLELMTKHPLKAMCYYNMATYYESKGQIDLAIPMLVQYLKIFEDCGDFGDPNRLLHMHKLALWHTRQENYDSAMPLFQKCLESSNDLLSKMSILCNYGRMCMSCGRLDLAETQLGECLEVAELLNADSVQCDFNTLKAALGSLGGLYLSQQKFSCAEPLLEEYLDISRATAGASHNDTIIGMMNLAFAYKELQYTDKAILLYAESLIFITDNNMKLAVMANLASLYESAGSYDLAEPLHVQSLALAQMEFGEHHMRTLGLRYCLAKFYELTGALEQAEDLLTCSWDVAKQWLGAGHEDTLKCMDNLAKFYKSIGIVDQAELLSVQCLQLRKANLD